MPKFNNVYCTLCAMICLQLLGCYGEVLRNIIKDSDQQEEKFNQMLLKLDQLEKKLNEGMFEEISNYCSYYMTIIH